MRDYRFRVWNPETETMTYNVGLDSISEYADETLVKMQQTGLKDRRGNNVYEADVIMDNVGIGVVKYEVKRGGYRVKYVNRTGMAKWLIDFMDEEFKRLEVIGNRFMTPELLKQEEEGG